MSDDKGIKKPPEHTLFRKGQPGNPEGRPSRVVESTARDNEVGNRKPPKHTRFKKGRSGNPKGRPSGAKNFKTELEEELCEMIIVREGGSRKSVRKQRALLKSMMAKAVQGDTRAASLVTNMVFRLLSENEPQLSDAAALGDDDLAILEIHEQRIRASCLRQEEPSESLRDSQPCGDSDEDESP